MKNIEIKVELKGFEKIYCILSAIGAKHISKLNQIDTYYITKSDERLKIREINNNRFELIHYRRPNIKRSKISKYQVFELSKKDARYLSKILKEILGVLVVVKKERDLWMYKNTRIHLDRVNKLGNFLELETVIGHILRRTAEKEHHKLIGLLDLDHYKSLPSSYSDLLLKKRM